MLVRLLYVSHCTTSIDSSMVETILSQSRENNAEHGVTGVLCMYEHGNVFMQVLEGAREKVNALYTNLVADSRHRDVTLLDYGEITERRFATWQMGRVNLNRVNLHTIIRFSASSTLDPYQMSGAAVLALLDELIDTAAIQSDGAKNG